ncbi:hypothetical protein [Roseinatronobacter sp.]
MSLPQNARHSNIRRGENVFVSASSGIPESLRFAFGGQIYVPKVNSSFSVWGPAVHNHVLKNQEYAHV